MTTRFGDGCLLVTEALIGLLTFSITGLAYALEPPTEPILRIDPGSHTAAIKSMATDGKGQWLATASDDKTIRLWSLADGQLVSTLRPPIGSGREGMIYATAFSPDGSVIAAAGWTQFDRGANVVAEDGVSIYLFERASGRLLRHLPNLPNAITSLAFSKDGRWLAATFFGKFGIRVFSTETWKQVAEDSDYGSDSYCADFSRDGRLITTSYDGFLRLYGIGGNRFDLLAKHTIPGGKLPYTANFSPDGQHVAVAFSDTPAVNVLDGNSLEFLFAPDTTGVRPSLGRVAWSEDGTMLFAAGRAFDQSTQQFLIRRWTRGGAGAYRDWPVTANNIHSLVALPGGRLAFGSSDPAWGVFDESGVRVLFHPPAVADFRGNWQGFRLSGDGGQVSFGYEVYGKQPAIFDNVRRDFLPIGSPKLAEPLLRTPNMEVTDWKNTTAPKLNGTQLTLQRGEISRSLAHLPNGEGFVLGTEWYLRAYTRNGKQRWQQPATGMVAAVNVSADGRWVVAGYSDGTIKWHRASDGIEQLTFFPHADNKRWIMWTPEGYYDASSRGEDLIGWHLNQGKDREARFIPNGYLYDVFFRPDIVQAKFRGDDISRLITITAFQALQNPPPNLSFLVAPLMTSSSKEKICYKATSTGGGIGEVRLFQNGKLVKSDGFYREIVTKGADKKLQLASLDSSSIQRSLRNLNVEQKSPSSTVTKSKGNEYEECQELEMMPGENEISAAAFNASNTVQSGLATIRILADRVQEESHLYVLAIGIDKYKDQSATLQFAVKDATDFRVMIQKKSATLYKEQNIHIENLSDGAASKEGIQKAIQMLADKVKPWDSFILFVASHGVLQDNQYYIVTAGFSGTTNPANLVSTNEIVGMSTGIKALSQLLIFDTCHAGGVDNIISGLYDARMGTLAKKMGLHIYASAGSTQAAMDGYQGNGLFTHSLLKSMVANRSADGKQISVVELGQQARQFAINISNTLGISQTPNIINFGKNYSLFLVN